MFLSSSLFIVRVSFKLDLPHDFVVLHHTSPQHGHLQRETRTTTVDKPLMLASRESWGEGLTRSRRAFCSRSSSSSSSSSCAEAAKSFFDWHEDDSSLAILRFVCISKLRNGEMQREINCRNCLIISTQTNAREMLTGQDDEDASGAGSYRSLSSSFDTFEHKLHRKFSAPTRAVSSRGQCQPALRHPLENLGAEGQTHHGLAHLQAVVEQAMANQAAAEEEGDKPTIGYFLRHIRKQPQRTYTAFILLLSGLVVGPLLSTDVESNSTGGV